MFRLIIGKEKMQRETSISEAQQYIFRTKCGQRLIRRNEERGKQVHKRACFIGSETEERKNSHEFDWLKRAPVEISIRRAIDIINCNISAKSTLLRLLRRILLSDTGTNKVAARELALMELGV